jgi:hypothetical protein
VASGREDRDMENRALACFWADRDWLDRRMASSMASLEVLGSPMDEVRRKCADIVVVGDRRPE